MKNEKVKAKLKKKLTVVLKADAVIIAEVEDPELWQRVLAAITVGTTDLEANAKIKGLASVAKGGIEEAPANGDALVAQFSAELNVAGNDLRGACDPTAVAPFINLDHRTWASWRKRTPEKGPAAVSAPTIVATLLSLWFRHLKKKHVTFKELNAVLSDLSIVSKNTSRAMNNCRWLQLKNKDNITLHPSHFEAAVGVARGFVSAVSESSNGGSE